MQMAEAEVERERVPVVLSLRASWSDRAKRRTLRISLGRRCGAVLFGGDRQTVEHRTLDRQVR